MSLQDLLSPLERANEVLKDGYISFSDPFFMSIFQDRSSYERSDLRSSFIHSSSKTLVLAMVVFFFIFTYYLTYGFVIGAIQEYRGESESVDRAAVKVARVKDEAVAKATQVKNEVVAAVDDAAANAESSPPETPTKKHSKSHKRHHSNAKKTPRKA